MTKTKSGTVVSTVFEFLKVDHCLKITLHNQVGEFEAPEKTPENLDGEAEVSEDPVGGGDVSAGPVGEGEVSAEPESEAASHEKYAGALPDVLEGSVGVVTMEWTPPGTEEADRQSPTGYRTSETRNVPVYY